MKKKMRATISLFYNIAALFKHPSNSEKKTNYIKLTNYLKFQRCLCMLSFLVAKKVNLKRLLQSLNILNKKQLNFK